MKKCVYKIVNKNATITSSKNRRVFELRYVRGTLWRFLMDGALDKHMKVIVWEKRLVMDKVRAVATHH